MKLFISIFAIGFALGQAQSTRAEKIATPTNSETAASSGYGPYGTMGNLPPADSSLSLIEMKSDFYPALKDLTRCDIRRDKGYGTGVVLVGEKDEVHTFATYVPEDLVKGDEMLKPGMERKVTYSANGVTSNWTAKYDKGKLIVNNDQNYQGQKMYSQSEFTTRTNIVEAGLLKTKYWVGGNPASQTVTCASPQVSSLKKKSRFS